MSNTSVSTVQQPLPPAIQTRADFAAAIHWAVRAAAERGARQMVWVDPDFADWPLNEPALHGVLTAWLVTPRRRLLLLAEHYDALPRSHPRFVAWRRNWAHAIEPRIQPDDESGGLPTLLIDDGAVFVQLRDRVRWRGHCALDKRQASHWREQIDALLQRSPPGFAMSQLGL